MAFCSYSFATQVPISVENNGSTENATQQSVMPVKSWTLDEVALRPLLETWPIYCATLAAATLRPCCATSGLFLLLLPQQTEPRAKSLRGQRLRKGARLGATLPCSRTRAIHRPSHLHLHITRATVPIDNIWHHIPISRFSRYYLRVPHIKPFLPLGVLRHDVRCCPVFCLFI